MRSNVKSSWQLYVIVDRAAVGSRNLAELTSAAIRGGADVIQLRDKAATPQRLTEEARRLLPLTNAAGIPLIINDHIDVAQAVDAAGVHLGQADASIAEARRLLGPSKLIGQSTHSLEQALAADLAGADYIGLGPLFPTPTKPTYGSIGLDLINEVQSRVGIPIICIGGINQTNVEQVIAAGARCVAVVRAICAAPDPESATRTLKQTLL
ncbi:MAG: thiamine phosphate synthase [Candidatus Omnitrophica bacterium]|nr:thiamine phosphate synthase [Candidatus Omnitrophota bacterium]